MSKSASVQRLAKLLQKNAAVASRFVQPAPEAELNAFVERAGPLPPAFSALYRLVDGTVPFGVDPATNALVRAQYLFPRDEVKLNSLAEIERTKVFWDGQAQQYSNMSAEERARSFHLAFWNPSWLPFAESDSQMYALAPGPCFGGPGGQVVRFDFKGDTFWEVLSESLESFLGTTVKILERGGDHLDRETLTKLNPRARLVELTVGETAADRFERAGTPLHG